MPRRGAGRYFFALNRRSPLSPAERGAPARALGDARALKPRERRPRDPARAIAFVSRRSRRPASGSSNAPSPSPPTPPPPFARPPPPPSTSVLTRVPSSTAPAPPPAAEMKKWKAVTMLAVPACGGLGVYLFAGMGHHEHHEQPVRAPTPTDPPLIPPLRSSRRTPPPAHPGRGRKISDSSTLRPPPPPLLHSSGVLVHAQATQAASLGRRLRPVRVRQVPGELSARRLRRGGFFC